MNNEWDDIEAAAIIESCTSPLLVTAKYPGTGKSRLAMHWARTAEKKMLVVCPTNALADKVKLDNFYALTLHTLLGRRPDEIVDETSFDATDVSMYNVILFEEVYFYTVRQLEWIAEFIAKYKDTHAIIANGDPTQNQPVHQNLDVAFDEYYNDVMASIFPRCLNLSVAKRYSEIDRPRIEALYDELRDDSLSASKVFDVCVRHGLQTVDWPLDAEAAAHSHVAFTNATVDRVNKWADVAKGLPQEWRVGDLVVGRKYARVAGKGKINSNAEYSVSSITNTHMTVTGLDGANRTLTIQSSPTLLRRPWCRTGHAIQGQTLQNKLFIHDANSSLVTARWMRTAITRCRTFDIVLVSHDDPMRLSREQIQQRIYAHRRADATSGRRYEETQYVTVDWARDRIVAQGYQCPCGTPLDGDWSIDRKDNTRAHTKGNCQVVCRRCQNASSHRPTSHLNEDDC